MDWKTKARIQRVIAALPAGREAIYYQLQRRWGALRQPANPLKMLRWLTDILRDLQRLDFPLPGRTVMEVGTGWRCEMPMWFSLLGAARVDTFDLHRYLKDSLMLETVAALQRVEPEVWNLLEPFVAARDFETRWRRLMDVKSLDQFFAATNIHYHAPADASATGLAGGSVDLHFSYTVLEHIPREVLAAILREASRVLSPRGLACHHIDPSDHFAHADPAISMVNFLQFEEPEWSRYNDNQFAYHNRLRVGDYEELYREVGHAVVEWLPFVDERSLAELRRGFPLAARYRGESPERLATTVVRVFSRPEARDACPQSAAEAVLS